MALAQTAIFVVLCFFVTATDASQKLKTYNTTYASFNDTAYFQDIFQFENYATINNNALQVTPDTAGGEVFTLVNRSGRVLLRRPFRLFDDSNSSQSMASFNSSFLINIFRPNNATAGEGLTFLVSPTIGFPLNSHGEYLGLTNATTDGNSTNQIFAVEFDTVKQDFDPDNNHVGLNVNGVRSLKTERLQPHGIELAPTGARFHNVWVNYDGIQRVIRVYIAEQAEQGDPTPPMPTTPILESDLDLRLVLNQYSYFGFSASTGNTTELNCVLRWNLTVNYFPEEKNEWLTILLAAGIPLLGIALIAGAYLGYHLHRKRVKARSKSSIMGRLRTLPGMPKEYEFSELKRATNNFDEKRKLGSGGYGVVYRGVLARENMEVAVKWFSRESLKGEDDFLAELTIINRLRHKHLVRLLGWCHRKWKLLLVYEYMQKGSLDKHLYNEDRAETLSWTLRYKIVLGVAQALHYLHYEYDQKVVHRDVKSSNILLDSEFNARLGDFGLARALENEKTSYAEAEGVLGTVGYIAPECFHTGRATQQSDVYAFGAVLLEVVSGKRPAAKSGIFTFLVDYVWSLYREGRILDTVDERVGDGYDAREAERLLMLGLACSHPIAGERPRTEAIVQMMTGSVPVPHVPPFKPAFVWPAMGPIAGNDSLATTIEANSITTSQLASITTSQFGSEWSPVSREYTDRSMV